MARPQRNAAENRKRKMDDHERRLRDLEQDHTGLADRVDTLELRLELETSYRFLRVEHSAALTALFQDVEQGNVEKKDIRERAGQALSREVREVLEQNLGEADLLAKSNGLSGGRCRWAPVAERQAVLDSWGVERHIERVSKQGSHAFSVRLQQGEPSRLCSEQVKKTLNGAFRVRETSRRGCPGVSRPWS